MSVNIIDRYILRELIKIFLITVGALTSLLYLDKFLFIAENLVNRGVSIVEIFLIIIYISPSYFALTIPISVLVASVATFNQFSASNEWVAMKSCHLSFMQSMRPVLMFSFFTYIVAVVNMVYALPWGNYSYKQKTFEIIKNRADINIKPNILNYDFKNLVILAKKREKKFEFRDVLIADTTQPKSPKIITANKARLAGWELVPGQLKSGTVARIDGNQATIALGANANQTHTEHSQNTHQKIKTRTHTHTHTHDTNINTTHTRTRTQTHKHIHTQQPYSEFSASAEIP